MRHNSEIHSRINRLLFIAALFLTLIIAQLFNIQVVQAKNYSEKATNELLRTSIQLAPRGEITDEIGRAHV